MQITIICLAIACVILFLLLLHEFSVAGRLKSMLKKAMQQVKKSEQARNDLLANLSHELRTPINTITGMTELMLQKELDADFSKSLRAVRTTGYELLSKVSDLLDYSQIISGDISIREDSYSITSTVNDVLINFVDEIRDKNLDMIVDCDPTIPAGLLGDEAKIRRVMTNILSNAVKFTKEGCIVMRISSRREEYGVNLRFEVSDTGIGMNEKEINRMFEEFYQGDSSRSRSAGGIGLGLSISFCIVRAMGGFLTVSSKKGEGTKVAFTIPQRVREDRPSITIDGAKELRAACYLNLEKFGNANVRTAYIEGIRHLAEGTGLPLTNCRTLGELRQLSPGRDMNLLALGIEELNEDRERILSFCDQIPVLVFIPNGYDLECRHNLIGIERPFYGVSIANALNGREDESYSLTTSRKVGFRAPDVRILVVDDNRMNLHVAEGLMGRYALQIDTASSGPECLTKLESQNYNLLFLDHMMPEMDGVETLKRIRAKQDSYYRELPVIALTANATDDARDAFLELGFNDFLAKPIDNLVLDRLLRKMIPRPMREEIIPGREPATEESDAAYGQNMTEAKELPGKAPVDPPVEISSKENDDAPVDMESALGFLGGDMDLFREIAGDFISMHDEMFTELGRNLQEKDWENYKIRIHALKSTGRTVGASRLGDMAEQLELCAKAVLFDEDRETMISRIEGQHPECMKEYEEVVEFLKEKCND